MLALNRMQLKSLARITSQWLLVWFVVSHHRLVILQWLSGILLRIYVLNGDQNLTNRWWSKHRIIYYESNESSYYTSDWRDTLFVLVAFGLPAPILYYFFVPESFRILISLGRIEEATKIAQKFLKSDSELKYSNRKVFQIRAISPIFSQLQNHMVDI